MEVEGTSVEMEVKGASAEVEVEGASAEMEVEGALSEQGALVEVEGGVEEDEDSCRNSVSKGGDPAATSSADDTKC